MKPGKPVVSARWFEKHKGHRIEATPVKIIEGMNPGQVSAMTDYKCLDCGKGLTTTKKPGDHSTHPNSVFPDVGILGMPKEGKPE